MSEVLNEMQVQIRHTCPACKGKKLMANPEHDPSEHFPQESHYPCIQCHGRGTVETWVPVTVFLQNIAGLDIQFL